MYHENTPLWQIILAVVFVVGSIAIVAHDIGVDLIYGYRHSQHWATMRLGGG